MSDLKEVERQLRFLNTILLASLSIKIEELKAPHESKSNILDELQMLSKLINKESQEKEIK